MANAPSPGEDPPAASADRLAAFPFDLRVVPPCVQRGGQVRVVLRTRPDAATAGAVAFSDGEAHGALTVGRAGADGSWAWDVLVGPDVPSGPATALVSAQDRTWHPDGDQDAASTSGEAASGRAGFRVADAC